MVYDETMQRIFYFSLFTLLLSANGMQKGTACSIVQTLMHEVCETLSHHWTGSISQPILLASKRGRTNSHLGLCIG